MPVRYTSSPSAGPRVHQTRSPRAMKAAAVSSPNPCSSPLRRASSTSSRPPRSPSSKRLNPRRTNARFTPVANDVAELDEAFPCRQPVSLLFEGVDRLRVAGLGLGVATRQPRSLGGLCQHSCARRVVDGDELQSPPVVGVGLADVQPERAIAREDEEALRLLLEVGRVRARGPGKLEGPVVVMSE